MKKCSNCGKIKTDREFYRRKNGSLRPDCRKCLLEYQTRRWRDRKAKAVELLGGKCQKCGYCRNLAALDFHHVDPATKMYSWNRLNKRPWQEIVEELAKCVLLCRNCHAEEHNPLCSLGSFDGETANRRLDNDQVSIISPTGSCPICQKATYGTKFCSTKCAAQSRRKVKLPPKSEIESLMRTMSWSAMGKKYGVSDSAVRKWAKKYGLLAG